MRFLPRPPPSNLNTSIFKSKFDKFLLWLKNIGLVWLKDDFRIKKNHALIEATKNHNHVVAFFLFKKKKFENQEAQKWWVSKSLDRF